MDFQVNGEFESGVKLRLCGIVCGCWSLQVTGVWINEVKCANNSLTGWPSEDTNDSLAVLPSKNTNDSLTVMPNDDTNSDDSDKGSSVNSKNYNSQNN